MDCLDLMVSFVLPCIARIFDNVRICASLRSVVPFSSYIFINISLVSSTISGLVKSMEVAQILRRDRY